MKPFSLDIRGRLLHFDRPVVMGILNCTPDSFYAPSRNASDYELRLRVETMLDNGADILDLGACSTRPGSAPVSADDEWQRLEPMLRAARQTAPDAVISIDTFRADIARMALDSGADIINDVSGCADPLMADTVAAKRAPYILTDPTNEGIGALGPRLQTLQQAGVADLIIDPGFGFGKSLADNYRIFADLDAFTLLGYPVLVGISRKSMLTRLLDITSDEALPATAMLNVMALERGASILRVHDVPQAVQAVSLYTAVTYPERLDSGQDCLNTLQIDFSS